MKEKSKRWMLGTDRNGFNMSRLQHYLFFRQYAPKQTLILFSIGRLRHACIAFELLSLLTCAGSDRLVGSYGRGHHIQPLRHRRAVHRARRYHPQSLRCTAASRCRTAAAATSSAHAAPSRRTPFAPAQAYCPCFTPFHWERIHRTSIWS
jgi:hypothetical protein